MKTSWCCVLLAMSVAALAIAADSDIDVAVRGVMTRYLRFGVTELADLERGRTARHSLEALAAGEIGVAGAVLVNAPKARFMERARDIVRFKRGPDVLQIGRFSNPPKIEDLAALTVDADDFDPRSCRLHDCDTRLPADVIQRIEREFDSNAPDADARASAEQALKLRPAWAEAYGNISVAFLGMQRWDEGIQAAQQALKLKPNYQAARNNLQWALEHKPK